MVSAIKDDRVLDSVFMSVLPPFEPSTSRGAHPDNPPTASIELALLKHIGEARRREMLVRMSARVNAVVSHKEKEIFF
jgi:hypothetical protein